MNLKHQLKLYLSVQGITASELARTTKIPKQSISDWLAGTSPRDLALLKKVADYFGITIDHLVFGDGLQISVTVENEKNADSHQNWIEGIFEVKFRSVKKSFLSVNK